MTPKERLFARMDGKPVDKIPNLNIVMLFAAKYAGVKFGAFCSDYRVMAHAATVTAKKFGIDILSTMSDAYRETYDYGADVRYQEDDLPICHGAFLTRPEDIDKLKPWDPLESVRMLDRIKAVELLSAESGDQYPVLGWVEGCMAEFADLATLTEGLIYIRLEPDFTHDCMEILTEQAIRCALAQIKAGADIIGIGDAAASIISPEDYREFVFPREKRIIEAVHAAGARTKLHICGNINHLLDQIVLTGSDIIDIDYMVDFDRAISLANGKLSICGHFDPVKVLLNGTPEDVRRWTEFCARRGDSRNIVAAGCEVPKMTPYENLLEVDVVLKEMCSDLL
jgi:uroporphyrinogen decarboxylase